jgi:hypothetical protein
MAGKNERPEIIFTLEYRKNSQKQNEAGRKLFSRLIDRTKRNQEASITAKARAAGGGGAPPAAIKDEKGR